MTVQSDGLADLLCCVAGKLETLQRTISNALPMRTHPEFLSGSTIKLLRSRSCHCCPLLCWLPAQARYFEEGGLGGKERNERPLQPPGVN